MDYMNQLGMKILLPTFRDLLQTGLVDAGHVDRVYYGYRDMASKTLRSDTTYAMIEDGGETDAPNKTGQTRFKRYMIVVEIGVKWTTSAESLQRLLDAWWELEHLLFDPENQHLPADGERQADIIRLFDVDSGYLFGTDNPAWRYRRCIALYDELFCQRSWE